MDDLYFRKTVYAEPFSKDPALIKAAAEDPNKQAFWDEVKAMEVELQAAMKIPVPEHLAEKLILRQSLSAHTKIKQKRPWYLALAASVVVASVLTYNTLHTSNNTLADDVFSHLSHIDFELMKSALVDTTSVNHKLASFNGQIIGDLGEIVSANYCYLDHIKSLHVIIRGEHGLTSLFVMPNSIKESLSSSFSNASFQGASFLLESAKIIIVGENKDDVDLIQQKAKSSIIFSS